MVRCYSTKGIKNRFSDEDLRNALRDLKEKKGSIRKIASTYGIPYTTLHAHHTGISKKRYGGPSTALTYAEEREIVQSCIVLQEMGFPIDKATLVSVVEDYLKEIQRDNPFTCGTPGPDWSAGFMKRWKKALAPRKPQHLSKKRAIALTKDTVGKWMEFVEQTYHKAGFFRLSQKELAKRLWNCDETAFATASSSKMVLARRGARSVYETMGGSSREHFTVHWCGNAYGDQVPPYILYKAQHLYGIWTLNGPSGSLYGVSTSGWMQKPNFYSWFVKGFLPKLRQLNLIPPKQPEGFNDTHSSLSSEDSDDHSTESSEQTSDPGVILFFDGHYSHVNLEVIKVAKENNVTLVTLPPNTTHALQPLDVGVFGPMKKQWQKILTDYKRKTHGRSIDKIVFPRLIKELSTKVIKRSLLENSFRAAGLYPEPKAAAIPYSKLAPAEAVTKTQHSPQKRPPAEGTRSTPAVKLRLQKHFGKLFQKQITPRTKSKAKPSSRVQLACYGEVLTSDEVEHRLRAQHEQKQKAKPKKTEPVRARRKTVARTCTVEEKDEDTCQGCQRKYQEDSLERQETWVGCEVCWRWYHYECGGLTALPEEDDPWACPKCS